jgi:hypothetical protein
LTERAKARIGITFNDAWLIAGLRTPFVDYNGALAHVSPIDLGIKVARDVLAQTATLPRDVGTVIAGSMAQASFDAYMLPRHIGLYAGIPIEVPAYQVQRVCGTGIEVGSPDRSCTCDEHGRHGGKAREGVPDHASGGGCLRVKELRTRTRGAGERLSGR